MILSLDQQLLLELQETASLSEADIARSIGASVVTVRRWKSGTSEPGQAQSERLRTLASSSVSLGDRDMQFASHGSPRRVDTLWDQASETPLLADTRRPPILERLEARGFLGSHPLASLALDRKPALTADAAFQGRVTAGKNTYTYDAHTYHTKVPPQGIVGLLNHYLPHGGLVLDPFAGSGMTGVAARVAGMDCILNELSPAAAFIADRFVAIVDHRAFQSAVSQVLDDVKDIRRSLYTTHCRTCGSETEALYLVWSYKVVCPHCDHEFVLWDHCRQYGLTVRDHKILREFPCPACARVLTKSRLRRTTAVPVTIGYRCCGRGRAETTVPLDNYDLAQVFLAETSPPLADGYYPTDSLPPGSNLNQPIRHGLDSVPRLYTGRNLAALSHIWRTIHRVVDVEVAGQLSFTFTSLYQRVTRLSEFRFWGGSGNTARLNVPFIFNESNVFLSFERKARAIADHLSTTVTKYSGRVHVRTGSATDMSWLPNSSVDLVFTDPPFGSNINYSEMNFLWESWLERRTDPSQEAIISKPQGKGLAEYESLMRSAIREMYRVLRPGHWMLLMFNNSSAEVWGALQRAITASGFEVGAVDAFDKEHGTFKQFVSPNTTGYDLVIHCRKPVSGAQRAEKTSDDVATTIGDFLASLDLSRYVKEFIHVQRDEELDVQRLYSEWTAHCVMTGLSSANLSTFRLLVEEHLHRAQDAPPGPPQSPG